MYAPGMCALWQRFTKALRDDAPFALCALPISWQLLFCFAPCVALCMYSFEGWNFAHIMEVTRPLYQAVIVRSLFLASITAWGCLIIGYPIAYYIACKATRLKTFLLFLLILPLWTNFLLHISAWFFVLEQHGFLNNLLISLRLISQPLHLLHTPGAVGIMMLHYYLPFMVLPLYAQLERLDMRLLEASADLGASWAQTIRYILLPMTLPAIRSGFLLVFVPAFGEFVIPELMGGDRTMYVGSIISHYILGTTSFALGAAFTVVSALVLIGATVLWYLLLGRMITPIITPRKLT